MKKYQVGTIRSSGGLTAVTTNAYEVVAADEFNIDALGNLRFFKGGNNQKVNVVIPGLPELIACYAAGRWFSVTTFDDKG